MAAWFSRVRAPKPTTEESERIQLPGGLWTKCPGCTAVVYSKELERNLNVCPKCGHHFRLSAEARLAMLVDHGSFEELDVSLRSSDPLNFRDQLRYKERIKKAEKRAGTTEAIKTGRARIKGHPVYVGVFEFFFMGGSMGSVVGEKLTRMIEAAIEEDRPVIIASASGGARMQEGIYSLMQMAKISAAISRLGSKGLPYISLLTDPTTGGVAASFAMQGDINIAEPGALIGFAGPRVIEQTIRRTLPDGFQRAEFLLEHGMVDMVVPRSELKDRLALLLELFADAKE
ncbi:MAG: acetyl-CoA carboxylase carboxyltransferase subunit beta [Bdellovibrionales bacterium]|nr:acetyl-CoA carboxylase carboxyltransferase subunit beta [Bdellovibrionales bacterium]